jgi:uncharacterized protein (UPF0276 family)
MMVKLGVPISQATYELAVANELDADYIVYYGQIGPERLTNIVPLKPVLLHDLPEPFWLNYENPFLDEVMSAARAMLDMAKCPWLSTGIGASAEPQAHRDGPYREADDKDLQSEETVVANIIKHGRRLKEWAGIPLLLENFNYHPTNAYEYICEPGLFSYLLDQIDCGMLLDVAHARISAHNMGWRDEKAYFRALPLYKVREIHVTRPGWQGDQMVDLHQPLRPDDLDFLGWVLDNTPAEAVTLEVDHTIDRQTLQVQLDTMRNFLRARQTA